jgi:hypothetical protein
VRLEILGLGLAFGMLFVGPLPPMNGSLVQPDITTPAWIGLPTDLDIAEVSFTGPPGMEASCGRLRILADEPAPALLARILTRLALAGFTIERQAAGHATGGPDRIVVIASLPGEGRRILLAPAAGSFGNEIHVSFSDAGAALLSWRD